LDYNVAPLGDEQAARARPGKGIIDASYFHERNAGDARLGGYAACYCESWNLESLQAVVEAAEAEKSPIIAGFNGGFLLRSGQKTLEQLGYYACSACSPEPGQGSCDISLE
jgi:hypothetical protein